MLLRVCGDGYRANMDENDGKVYAHVSGGHRDSESGYEKTVRAYVHAPVALINVILFLSLSPSITQLSKMLE